MKYCMWPRVRIARSRPGSVSNAKDVLLDLYSTDAEYSADALEVGMGGRLDAVNIVDADCCIPNC